MQMSFKEIAISLPMEMVLYEVNLKNLGKNQFALLKTGDVYPI
jgi:hypothetical protein